MTRAHFGLYGGGAVSATFIARLPHLVSRMGPVAASSFRVASRIVNSLRAGYAVKDCGELEKCRALLVAVPPAALAQAVAQLGAAGIGWTGKVVLLCECGPGSRALDPLRQHGAAAGSLTRVEGSPGRYVAEGDAAALREARRMAGDLRGRLIELHRNGAALYATGLAFATSLFTPLIAASVDTLRKAGCDAPGAAQVAANLFERTLRGWMHSGRKSWSGPLADGGRAEVRRQFEALAAHDPRAARYYRDAAAFALGYFRRHPELLRQLERQPPFNSPE